MVCIYFSCIHLIGKIPLNFSTFCKPTVSPRSSVFSHLDLASAGLHAINTSNTIDPVSTSPTNSNSHAAITDDAILTVLNACFHADMPYMWLGTSHLLAITDNAILTVLNACFHADMPYTQLGTSHLLAITDDTILTILNTCFCADIPYTWLGTSHLLAITDEATQGQKAKNQHT